MQSMIAGKPTSVKARADQVYAIFLRGIRPA